MFFSKKFLMVAVVAAAVSVVTSESSRADFAGSSVTLASLLDGGSILVGDKLFTNFTYHATGDMPSAANVNVIGGTDGAGNFGLEFQGAFHDLPGGTGSDALIGYTVTVNNGDFLISDAHLHSNPSVLGNNGTASIAETFNGLPANGMSAGISVVGGTTVVNKPDDSTVFLIPQHSLSVMKDILADGGSTDGGGVPSFSFIDQTYSQTALPEPSSVLLLASGSVIIGLVARRRKFSAKA
jgi:hypothetical protein